MIDVSKFDPFRVQAIGLRMRAHNSEQSKEVVWLRPFPYLRIRWYLAWSAIIA